jgi:hypothetical protein
VVGGGEPLHIRADLGHQHFCRALPDARDGVQLRNGRGEGLRPHGDLRADLGDTLIQEVKLSEVLRLQEALVWSESADRRLLHMGNLRAQPSCGPGGEPSRLGLPFWYESPDLATRLTLIPEAGRPRRCHRVLRDERG